MLSQILGFYKFFIDDNGFDRKIAVFHSLKKAQFRSAAVFAELKFLVHAQTSAQFGNFFIRRLSAFRIRKLYQDQNKILA